MKFILPLTVVLLSGCATGPFGSATSGGASYTYSHTTAEGGVCSVQITSARDVAGGRFTLDDECHVNVEVGELDGGAMSTVSKLVDRLPVTK